MFKRAITSLERSLAYFPELTLKGTPEHVGLDYEDRWIETGDGNRSHAWWIPGPTEWSMPRATWVYFHGNGGNISARIDGYRDIHRRLGANLLTVDYRGFGLSPGKPSEEGTYSDGRAAVHEAIRLRDMQGRSAGPLVLFGVSMGAAVATRVALDIKPDAVVVESPPSSFFDLAGLHYPWTRWIPLSLLMQYRYETRSHVQQLDAPLLVLHGDQDDVVPMESAQLVYDSANEPKRMQIIRGGTHERPDLVDPDAYYRTVSEFIAEHADPGRREQHFAAD